MSFKKMQVKSDRWYEAREHWLKQEDRTIGDVMMNQHGDEYILVEADDHYEMVFLPYRLQTNYGSNETK